MLAWGAMVHTALEAAAKGGARVRPGGHRPAHAGAVRQATILASVQKTGRVVIVHEAPRTWGFGAELAAIIAEKAMLHLEAPILRVTGFDTPFPYTLEHEYLPDADRDPRRRRAGGELLMVYEFRLPDIGEGVVEGEVVRWLVKEGDVLVEDQPMVEMMTDKATVEIPSPRAGRVAQADVRRGAVARWARC